MVKYLALTLSVIFAALGVLYFFIGVPKVYREYYPDVSIPHAYNDPSRAISEIRVTAFYFVPQSKAKSIISNWREVLEENLQKLEKFHALQFQGKSSLKYQIFPEPVVGLQDSVYYDTDNTGGGNPHALLRTASEIEQRVFRPSGDIRHEDFSLREKNVYPVLFILYEGVGASGGIIYESELESEREIAEKLGIPESIIFKIDVEAADGFFLLSSAYLARPELRSYGASVMVHEFYHTLGLPDKYEVEEPTFEERILSPDLMGAGRKRPLEKTYLERAAIRGFGL